MFNTFEYEPLKVSPSKALVRRAATYEYEKVSVTHFGILDGEDIYYPVHSDGVVGNWTTSTIEVIGSPGTNWFLRQDLKNVYVAAGTLDLKITSERLVPVLNEQERF